MLAPLFSVPIEVRPSIRRKLVRGELATRGLEKGRFRPHIPGMATIVQCNCGAEYRRTEEKFLVPHTGDAVCAVCGAALESWSKSTHVPSYELIERPDRKAE